VLYLRVWSYRARTCAQQGGAHGPVMVGFCLG